LDFLKTLPAGKFNGGGHNKAVGMSVTGFDTIESLIDYSDLVLLNSLN
jgi:hypothetical protein